MHHVVQNSSSTTFPLMEPLLNFSPAVVVALKRGANSLALLSPGPCAKAELTKIEARAIRRAVFLILILSNGEDWSGRADLNCRSARLSGSSPRRRSFCARKARAGKLGCSLSADPKQFGPRG